jgi:hypothetical protein
LSGLFEEERPCHADEEAEEDISETSERSPTEEEFASIPERI